MWFVVLLPTNLRTKGRIAFMAHVGMPSLGASAWEFKLENGIVTGELG